MDSLNMNSLKQIHYLEKINIILSSRVTSLLFISMKTLKLSKRFLPGGGGGRTPLYWLYTVCAATNGMVFQPFWS